jgi:hypothetical protein
VKTSCIIVGCNHGIQVGRGGFTGLDRPDQNEQREYFRAMLEEICAENKIQIALEEDGDVEETTGKQVADQNAIPWRDINTSDEDKDRLGIPRNYAIGPYTSEQKSDWNRQRERFMVEKINEYGCDTRILLVICGFDHLQPLVEILGRDGTPVRMCDYRRLPWFREGVFADDPE